MNAEIFINKLTPLLKDKQNKLEVIDYSAKSVVVFGNSIAIKATLKQMGGKYNAKLKRNDDVVCGWVFPIEKKNSITKFIEDVNGDDGILSLNDVKYIIDNIFKENEKEMLEKSSPKTQMADYNTFVGEQMELIKKENPEMSFADVMVIISKKWEENK